MPSFQLTRPVFLIGFNGAGKTTLARKLARRCGLASADVDHGIEREYGMSICDLLEKIGEDAFRELEARALQGLLSGAPMVISCGGGVVCGARSRQIIGECGFVVHMFVTASESAQRVSNHSTRPYFRDMESICATNRDRMPYYRELADATVETAGKESGQLVREVQEILVKEGILCPLQK